MKSTLSHLLRAGLPATVVLIGIASSSLQAQTIAHRYEFNGNVADSVGNVNGTASRNTDNFLEAPKFGTFVPTGASGPTQSIEFGFSDGSKKSYFTAASSIIQNQASAGSVSMFIRPEATTSTAYRYAFGALPSPDGFGFTIGQQTLSGNQVLNATVNATSLGSSAPFTTPIPENLKWYHVALTWVQSGANLTRTFYLDGVEVATSTATGSIAGLATVRVGSFGVADTSEHLTNQFDGRMYDLQIYNGALSEAQVKSLNANPGLTLSQIPEPSSYAVLAGAACLMLVALRRRRHSVA
jgi:hypothetical protein